MATVMADGQTPAELDEELTVQRVILESLADQTFEGVEESRREAAKEIERLKAIIGQSKQSQAPAQHGDVSGELPPAGTSRSLVSSQDVEIVDLTGSDVEDDATYIAEQIKAENRAKQELRDRQLAQQLSQESPAGPSSRLPSNPEGQNPLSRLMATQRANSRGLSGPSDSMAGISSHGFGRPGSETTMNMPGAYDPSWDTPYGFPATASPAPGPPFAPSRAYGSGLNHGLGPHTMPTFLGAPQAGNLGLGRVASLPSIGDQNLMDIINRTSHFNYSTYSDENGQQFPDRLTSYLSEAYHDPRVTEKELDDLLQNIRPDMDIPERNRNGTPTGLRGALYLHQELALSWMKKMEDGSNKGGILADDMGLGKTISTLALMLDRPQTKRPKTNLIIGPLSLIRQWEDELKTKTRPAYRMSVFVYHKSKNVSCDDLQRYDVVLTTYGIIAAEWKRLHKFLEENRDRTIDFNDRASSTNFPLLHPQKAEFYRVILDEAQHIKNEKTKTAKACHSIKATYRWCLTGTPMMNGVVELYSLVKFLKIKPYCHWDRFRESFGTLWGKQGVKKSVAMERLRALLRAIMLRRKKDSELEGKPILNLPDKSEEVVHADLCEDERHFYKQLEEKSQVQFSKYLRDGSVGKNYSNILVLLLRMRQACCHPHLNLDVDDAAPLSANSEDMLDRVKSLERPVVERIKALEAFECPICFDAVQSPSFFVPCGHDSCQDCLTRLVDNALSMHVRSGEGSSEASCPVCRGSFDPKKCFSYDAFRTVHMPETIVKSQSDPEDSDSGDDDSDSDNESDADDVDSKGNLKGFVVDDELHEEDDMAACAAGGGSADAPVKQKRKKKKGKKKEDEVKPSMLKSLRIEAGKNQAAYKKYMRYLRKTWMPSAKVTACMELLEKIKASKEKAIVFSQWTLLLDLLEVAMTQDKSGPKPLRYDGSMSGDQRAQAARDFTKKPEATVMLVSLRAGNAGLNLTAANNVIIMDPFWNPYIEMQAVDRAHRIGQTKDVKVHRILTQETVEDRIMELQERKKAIVEAALDETESMKIGRLNVNELKFLFNGRD
ncbi:SWI/SNF family DNA-dependent ATPase Ris1 [Purpureocillium lilacinum]|uniref:SWI/SNF family DNA-dependent ATPase Ris1 n=1 Tax=Purpureocillium lilacinum TaxID=33203 RepID=A0A179HIX4_PURLI|nr:SWI/SNF family DNA-dependent ATPase Ris1 [Purpureocillium lilacinum]OAQ89588.1 SWI/SNF family DNA-dependent ATPase Ris1 [Purpureocillium lilacinum]